MPELDRKATSVFAGKVVRSLVAPGSKSERQAVVLEGPTGKQLILRRKGGNPFSDPELDKLVGCHVEAEGDVLGQTLIASTLSVVKHDEDA